MGMRDEHAVARALPLRSERPEKARSRRPLWVRGASAAVARIQRRASAATALAARGLVRHDGYGAYHRRRGPVRVVLTRLQVLAHDSIDLDQDGLERQVDVRGIERAGLDKGKVVVLGEIFGVCREMRVVCALSEG